MADAPLNKHILVIDDELLIVMSVERALSRIGCRITTASTLKGFLSCLDKGPFDLVIADLHLKDMTVEEIKEEIGRRAPQARYLIMSGAHYEGDEQFLPKPFMIDELRQKVRRLLERP